MIEYGWAAEYKEKTGEKWDMGAGWASYQEAHDQLVSAAPNEDDFINVRIYYAQTSDNWETWQETNVLGVKNSTDFHRAEDIGMVQR